MEFVEYHLLMRVPIDQLVDPEDIEALSPYLTVVKAPSELEIARVRGLIERHRQQPSLSPEQFFHLLGGDLSRVRFEAYSGEQFELRQVPGAESRYYLNEITDSGLMNSPEAMDLNEVIAIVDYCGGLDAQLAPA